MARAARRGGGKRAMRPYGAAAHAGWANHFADFNPSVSGPGGYKSTWAGFRGPFLLSPPWPRRREEREAGAALARDGGAAASSSQTRRMFKRPTVQGKRSRDNLAQAEDEKPSAEPERGRSLAQAPASGTSPSEIPLRPPAVVAYNSPEVSGMRGWDRVDLGVVVRTVSVRLQADFSDPPRSLWSLVAQIWEEDADVGSRVRLNRPLLGR